MYSYEIGKHDTESLVQFATTFFKNIKANKVPREKIWFDSTIETIVSKMKVSFRFSFVVFFIKNINKENLQKYIKQKQHE